MMKRFLLLLTIMCVGIPLFGQGSKKMNSIKRSSHYLYAESTMPTEKEAFEIASELLYQQVKEYAEGKKSFQNRDILIRDIAQVRDSIQLQRGDMVKVFLYVKKSDIVDVENVTLIPNESDDNPIEIIPGSVNSEDGRENNSAEAEASYKLPVAWQQQVIDQLLAADSFQKAKALLSRMKAEFKIRKTGPISTCNDLDHVYLLIGRNNSVITVLGPEQSGRADFHLLKKVSLDKYSGADMVWFSFSK